MSIWEIQLLPTAFFYRKHDEVKWNDEFKDKIYYSPGKSNSYWVFITFYGGKKIYLKKRLTHKNGCILILDTETDESEYILINLYNSNTESEQIHTPEELLSLLNNLEIKASKHMIFSGDFNLYFNISLDATGGSPLRKKCSLSKITKIKELLKF